MKEYIHVYKPKPTSKITKEFTSTHESLQEALEHFRGRHHTAIHLMTLEASTRLHSITLNYGRHGKKEVPVILSGNGLALHIPTSIDDTEIAKPHWYSISHVPTGYHMISFKGEKLARDNFYYLVNQYPYHEYTTYNDIPRSAYLMITGLVSLHTGKSTIQITNALETAYKKVK